MSFSAPLVLLLMLMTLRTEAWNCAGHMITTQIALQLLPTEANRFFADITDYQQMHFVDVTSLTEASCWPDDIKSFTKAYSTWHYYDQCLLRNSNGSDVMCPATNDGYLYVALSNARSKLRDSMKNMTAGDQAFWLSFLVHLVGDIHQPLHVTTLFDTRFPNGDLGGNNFVIYVDGVKNNLHSFHDNVGGLMTYGFPLRPLAEYPLNASSIEDMSTSLILSPEYQFPDTVTGNTNVTSWLEEGFALGSKVSYSLPDGSPLPFGAELEYNSSYVTTLRKTLQGQLALGGRRLANILTEIYNMNK